MSITDWVQVITQIITAVTAVVMATLAYKTYLQPPEQISEDEPMDASDQNTKGILNKVMVFKTSKQETWLEVLPTGLHCYINDTRENKGGPQWTIPKAEIGNILAFNQYAVNPSAKVKTGTFDIGQKKNWFYTKAYFPEPEYLHGVLHHLLENANS
ncbi:MAG: hypothetical protein P8L18_10320 [Verrucomicrobiota bacterium]|nr:hypothetical protein [Verrucomicrobiota bacterium]